MCKNELKQKCVDWFYQLVMIIGDDYKVVGSCNQDISLYLIPNGTEDEISYYGKPENSFRVSDHWNWYSNIKKKCDKVTEIQCHNISLIHPKREKKKVKPLLRYGPRAWVITVMESITPFMAKFMIEKPKHGNGLNQIH